MKPANEFQEFQRLRKAGTLGKRVEGGGKKQKQEPIVPTLAGK